MRMVGKNGPLGRSIYTMDSGKEVAPLDVVRAQTTGPQPVNSQPENYAADGPRAGVVGSGLNGFWEELSNVARQTIFVPAGNTFPPPRV